MDLMCEPFPLKKLLFKGLSTRRSSRPSCQPRCWCGRRSHRLPAYRENNKNPSLSLAHFESKLREVLAAAIARARIKGSARGALLSTRGQSQVAHAGSGQCQ
jgi:hypothetical protein